MEGVGVVNDNHMNYRLQSETVYFRTLGCCTFIYARRHLQASCPYQARFEMVKCAPAVRGDSHARLVALQ